MNIHWKDWCWSWNSNTLATWCEELTYWTRSQSWERFKGGGKGDDRGRDGWMASPTQWTWVWASSGRWWRTGKPGVLQSMGPQRVGHNWACKCITTMGCLNIDLKEMREWDKYISEFKTQYTWTIWQVARVLMWLKLSEDEYDVTGDVVTWVAKCQIRIRRSNKGYLKSLGPNLRWDFQCWPNWALENFVT